MEGSRGYVCFVCVNIQKEETMEEKKIVYKSIEEQLSEDAVTVTVVTEKTTAEPPRKKKKKVRLKKSVRRTIGSLMLATSIVIAAIPVGGVSADSSGVYKGSTKKVSDFTIEPTNVQKDLSVPTAGPHAGGFPLIPPEKDAFGNYIKTDVGGRGYYIVDTNGYKSNDYVRPIYALDSGKSDIEKYFESNGTVDTYIPPGGKINLSVGYITESTTSTTWEKVDKSQWWVDNNRLYVPELCKFTIDGYTMMGKRIQEYDRVEVKTFHVVFKLDDFEGGGIISEFDVRYGEDVTTYPEYRASVTSTKGGTFVEWLPTPGKIMKDTEFVARFNYPSGSGYNTDSLDPAASEAAPEEGTATGGEGAEEENAETVPEDGNGEGTQEGAEPSEEPAAPAAEPPAEGDTYEEEEHEIENSEAGGPGLTGVLLQYYPADPPDPSAVEYKDQPTKTYYVCDEYAAISNIRNKAFENTTNVRIVDLPTNILAIGNDAFKGSGVTSITLGDGLVSLGASAFEDCQDLTSATYSNNMALSSIGSRAFANSSLSTLTNGERPFLIPYTVKEIGDGAFLGAKMSTLSFERSSNCEVGDCAFAQCKSLTNVNLDFHDGTQLTINNLDTVTGLFAEDDLLVEANMPKGFSGELTEGTFGSCEAFNHIIFQDGGGTFHDGEFDKWQVTVEGPKPTCGGNYLNPTGNSSKSYTSSLKDANDYVYRYFDTDGNQHEVANELGYTHSDDFFKDKSAATTNKFVFDVDETTQNTLCGYYDKTPAARADLEIGNNIGQRNDGDIPVRNIAANLFEGNTSIQYLQLNANLDNINDSAFKNTQIEKLWAYVDGTNFLDNSFADNTKLTRVTFAYGEDGPNHGESGSVLGPKSFANNSKLDNVDFYDDNLTDGDKTKYARFNGKESIAGDAFYWNGRTAARELVFKGPMKENYGPYEFAIDPASKISDNQVFTKYYSGNPWNLTAQYQIEAFDKENPVTGKTEKYSGVCLLKYPNMSSRMDKDDIDDDISDLAKKVTVDDIEAIAASSRTVMQQDCLVYTKDLVVPYGIDYIDIAESQIHDAAKKSYYVFQDDKDLYKKDEVKNTDGKPIYKIFQYNPDLLSVTFENGGVSEYPDRMFEGTKNLEVVTFKNNVTNLGKLPFYMPDTEAYEPKYSKYEPDSFPHLGPGNNEDDGFRSHLEGVYFLGEGDGASSTDEKYYSTTDGSGFSTGIIKGNDGKRVKVVQIVPSRGDYCGAESITADELADVDEYADYAARDCDALKTVIFPEDGCDVSYGCFMDCDRLKNITMPNNFFSVADQAFAGISTNMDVTFPYNNVNLNELPFESASKDGLTMPDVTFHVHKDAEYLMDYADKNDNINYVTIADAIKLTYLDKYDSTYYQQVDAMANGYTFGQNYPPAVLPTYKGQNPTTWTGRDKYGNAVNWMTDVLTSDTIFTSEYGTSDKIKVYFIDEDGSPIKTVSVAYGEVLTKAKMPNIPEKEGKKFLYWSPDPEGEEITEEMTCRAVYQGSSTSSTSTTSSTGGGGGGGGGGGSSSKSSSSKSSSSSKGSSSSSSTAYPVYVNSQDTIAGGSATPITGTGSTVYIDEGSGGGYSDGSGSGGNGNRGSGNTSVVSTTGGISDTGKISATVNGSSDNYVIKITQTQEADQMGEAALHNEYGENISPIRYLPFDISLYDSTGTNKISPVPEGVSVSITMPIPDDLAIYGGNAKVASTAGGVLEKITPRFTMINGVPCMTYTCTHLSPYVVYVDTNNLTEAGISDATPKTADGIHPKWFLCFGLAAIAVVMFLKKDPEEYLRKAA